jgi:hypothetical protein
MNKIDNDKKPLGTGNYPYVCGTQIAASFVKPGYS